MKENWKSQLDLLFLMLSPSQDLSWWSFSTWFYRSIRNYPTRSITSNIRLRLWSIEWKLWIRTRTFERLKLWLIMGLLKNWLCSLTMNSSYSDWWKSWNLGKQTIMKKMMMNSKKLVRTSVGITFSLRLMKHIKMRNTSLHKDLKLQAYMLTKFNN